VHDDGTITVPDFVAKDLMHGAGFALAPDQPADDGGIGADVPPSAVVGLGDPIE
jgi:hypothetical protein